MTLARFFDEVAPMLEGRCSAAMTEQALGPSPSGTAALGFYATLVQRNYRKILGDFYGSIRILAKREDAKLWGRLARGYIQHTRTHHWDPNRFAAGFSDYLSQLRESDGSIPSLFEEIADYEYTRHLAATAPDDIGDGFEQRIFVRQYTHAVPEILRLLAADSKAELPPTTPLVTIIYRHALTHELRLFSPTAVGLAALAHREGVEDVPELFRSFSTTRIDQAVADLVENGVLVSAPPSPKE